MITQPKSVVRKIIARQMCEKLLYWCTLKLNFNLIEIYFDYIVIKLYIISLLNSYSCYLKSYTNNNIWLNTIIIITKFYLIKW